MLLLYDEIPDGVLAAVGLLSLLRLSVDNNPPTFGTKFWFNGGAIPGGGPVGATGAA